jgi:hypothetical protein
LKKIEQITDKKTLDWLLEKEDPSVRFFTQVDLLNEPQTDKEVIESKKAILSKGIVPKILLKQHEGGYWVSPERFYTAKYTGTVWQLMILAELGASGSDTQINRSCEFILDTSQEKESFAFAHRTSAKANGGLKSEVIPCLTGNMVWCLIKHGFLDDPRVQKGIEWICRYQRADDETPEAPSGWPYDRYEMCWGRHTCFMGVVKSLKALSAIPVDKWTPKVREKISFLAEFLLKHHIHKRSHDLAKVSKPGWRRFGFPLMYQTDILEILEILTNLGYHDPRMQEAFDILQKKMTKDGRWKLENSFNGRMIEDIEEIGKESKWITQKALKVLLNY